jgi:hypothetical protein
MKTQHYFECEPSKSTLSNPLRYRKVIDVEAFLHWVYQDQAADHVTGRVMAGLSPAGYGSNMAAIERCGLLGGRIDGDGGVAWAGDLHPDAEAAHDVMCAWHNATELGLMIHHAKGGTRPEIIMEEPRPVALINGKGKPKMEYFDSKGRRPAYCHLRYLPEPEHVTYVRRAYVLWWDALTALAVALDDLGSHELKSPGVAREPWVRRYV